MARANHATQARALRIQAIAATAIYLVVSLLVVLGNVISVFSCGFDEARDCGVRLFGGFRGPLWAAAGVGILSALALTVWRGQAPGAPRAVGVMLGGSTLLALGVLLATAVAQ